MYPNRVALRWPTDVPRHRTVPESSSTRPKTAAHGRRLSRAVRTEEPGQAGRARGKRAPVKRRGRYPKRLLTRSNSEHRATFRLEFVPTTPAIKRPKDTDITALCRFVQQRAG